MKSVEAAMVAYARHFGESENDWAVAGLLHDFDYERYPNDAHAADAEHPAEGVRHLRSLGVSDEICQAILGHAHYTGVARETRMAKTLFAVDELCGLITAAALVRPSKSVLDLEASSVKKRMKDKAFARGVSREDVILGAQELGVELEPHIAFVIEAMRARADEIGLRGTVAA
ncbi:HAD family hydrolase [Pseudogemmatithrix spongiicola]|uniref:HAD family hydrolase n=2 Tax=Pseudogemmatithrix spongiicola TaxID=3062599 RepID=A0AA49JSE2_9BACT|nr:HAD family hydrolase [Gemmatimonadaceae bacterium 'strain 138']WKW13999.1 HAD family hydrolase [Gemmatimonadaceae bacterium 'strain 318']